MTSVISDLTLKNVKVCTHLRRNMYFRIPSIQWHLRVTQKVMRHVRVYIEFYNTFFLIIEPVL